MQPLASLNMDLEPILKASALHWMAEVDGVLAREGSLFFIVQKSLARDGANMVMENVAWYYRADLQYALEEAEEAGGVDLAGPAFHSKSW